MNFAYLTPMVLTVIANVAYHFCQKEIKSDVNPLVSLFFTYLSGMILTLICMPLFFPNANFIAEAKQLNWATFALGIGIVGLELGFLLAYRAGWNVSIAALYSNVMVTVILLPVGLLFYKESLSAKNGVGLVFALVGLVLMAIKS